MKILGICLSSIILLVAFILIIGNILFLVGITAVSPVVSGSIFYVVLIFLLLNLLRFNTRV